MESTHAKERATRARGRLLLQLLAQKQVRFGPQRVAMESSTFTPDRRWGEPRDEWQADEEETEQIVEQPEKESEDDREPSYACLLPADPGRCKALDKKWYFNKEKGVCETFYYGGCGGNANNFGTAEECRDACLSK